MAGKKRGDVTPIQPGDKFGRLVTRAYYPGASAVELVTALHSHAGTSCEDAELAAWLNQSVSSGTYRSRRSAARMFGLIDISQGRVSLTALGRESMESRAARAEAFLRPELFRAMYDQYRGQALPPPPAIERHMEQLGVSPKQKERARQVFQKSAHYAGYIDQPTGRFVRPGAGPETERQPNAEEKPGSGDGGGNDGGIDPIIRGLLARLPKSGDVWPEAERKLWLGILENSFRLIYKDSQEDEKNHHAQDRSPEDR